MKRTTERKWHSWLNGVALTICPSMWRRQRRLCWTSGETPLTTPHWPSTARLWRESAALNSWGCTSQRISPGPPTPCHSPRRHNSAYTFSAGWKEQVSHHPSSPHSIGAPLRVCWPAASLSGTGTAVLLTARPSSGQWTRLQRSSVPLSHPSWTFSLHDAPAKPTASWRTPHTLPSLFQLLPSGRRYRSIRARSARLLNIFFPQAVRALNSNHTAPLWNPMQTPTSWNMDHPPPSKHPPTLPHQRKNCMKLFCAIQVCYTQVSGPVQTTCSNTLSSMHTRHFSHTAVCTQSHKRLSNICMFTCSCTTNHLVLFLSQLLDSQCFSLHMYSIYVKHSYSLYFLFVFFIFYL